VTPHDRFEQIYTDEAAGILRYARYRVGADMAEDIVAETFSIAWQKLEQVPEPPRPWLLATARRVSANHLRARRKQIANEAALAEFDAVNASGTENIERRRDLIAALKVLPPVDREAVLLVTWYGLSNGEAAQVLDCSTTAFAVRLHRARRRLIRVLRGTDTAPLLPTDHMEVLR
jgi:RNA polymerase sigma-70 factor (ECF subfamily)